jgi:hypothetical protein
MSRDRTVGDTFYIAFTTRAFATGIPTVLAGTPVVSAYEDAGLTQITAGITLGVDHDSVVGMNMLTIVATGGNGFESGKDYNLAITTGTVGGVSVVGEIVGQFSLGLSAAAVDLANGTDGLGALKSDTATTLVDTADMQPKVAKIPLSDGVITWNSTALGSVNAECDTALTDYDGPTNTEMEARTLVAANYFDPAVDTVALVTTTTTATNLTTNNDKTGYALSSAGDQSIADLILPATNTAFPDIEFLFVAASDHVTPVTGATGTAVTRSIDGGAFGSGTGTLAEVANGIYQYDASSADMNGKIITFRFVGSGGTPGAPDDTFVTVVTSK